MITLLVIAAIIGIAVMVGRNLGPRPPALALAVARMDRALIDARHAQEHAHSDGGWRATVATHEAGHMVMAEMVGSDWYRARIAGGGGYVYWNGTSGDDYTQVVNAVAFMRGGEYAARTGAGAGSDRDAARRAMRNLPSGMRGRALREGERLARRGVAVGQGRIRRYAQQLNEKGGLR